MEITTTLGITCLDRPSITKRIKYCNPRRYDAHLAHSHAVDAKGASGTFERFRDSHQPARVFAPGSGRPHVAPGSALVFHPFTTTRRASFDPARDAHTTYLGSKACEGAGTSSSTQGEEDQNFEAQTDQTAQSSPKQSKRPLQQSENESQNGLKKEILIN